MTGYPLPPLLVWALHFASSDGGLVEGGQTGQWEYGEVIAGPISVGPVWATNVDGPYLNDTEDWLQIEVPEISGLALPSLVLTHWYSVREGDSAVVEVDAGGGLWSRLEPAFGYPHPDGFVGDSLVYQDAVFDLTGFGPSPSVRLKMTSDLTQANLGWYLSDVALWDGDVVAPVVSVANPPVDTQDLVGPYLVEAEVLDDHVALPTLYYSVAGGPPVAVPMKGSPAVGAIPGQPPDTSITVWVEATDGQNLGRWPSAGAHAFRVFLAAPTDVQAVLPALRPVTDHLTLTWDAPQGPHEVVAYWVTREGSADPIAVTTALTATIPLEALDPGRFHVYALYDVGLSDPSEVVAVDVEVPVLDVVEPSAGLAGEDLYVHLSGRSLYLADGATTIELGKGVEVLAVDVLDVGEAVVTAHVSFGASPGPRDVTISGVAGTFVFQGAFAVLDPTVGPRIVGVTPEELVQGTTEAIQVESTVSLVAPVKVLVDPDLTVEGLPDVDGVYLSFRLTAAPDAATGPHTVAIDDGESLRTVVIDVVPSVSGLRTSCATSRVHPGWLAVLALVLLRRTTHSEYRPGGPR